MNGNAAVATMVARWARWSRERGEAASRDATAAASGSLRVGVERSMVTTVAVAAPLLVLQSFPAFMAERPSGALLIVLPLGLAVLQCLGFPISLLRRSMPARRWLSMSAGAYFALVVLERVAPSHPLPDGFVPWLVGLACIAFSAVALSARPAKLAASGSVLIICGLLVAYAGRVDTSHLVMVALGHAALASGLILGVRVLRRRAHRSDLAERAAAERFEISRRFVALEDERTRTDALLHDSVLTTLLVAASGHGDGARTTLMARNALAVVADTHGSPEQRRMSTTFERAVAAVEREFEPMRGLVRLDLAAAYRVQLPERVADTLIAAMLQAVSNSIKHAGPLAARVARAVPLPDGGLRISVRDDGVGFDMAAIAQERLGVRVSILERVRLVGGSAEIRTTPGDGTTVLLEWSPESSAIETAQHQEVLA